MVCIGGMGMEAGAWRERGLGGSVMVLRLPVVRDRRSSAAKRMKAWPSVLKGRTKFVSFAMY